MKVTPQGEVHLRRAVVTVDCGLEINPGSVEAQIQGGLLFGLSAALFGRITIGQGAIQEGNFDDYRVLRMNETPTLEVYAVKNGEPPGGLGEVGTAIAAPALGNAIYAATGVRLRELPVERALLAQNSEALKKVLRGGSREPPAPDGRTGSAV